MAIAAPPGGRASRIQESFRGSAASRGYGRRHEKWRLVILRRDPVCRIQKMCGRGISTASRAGGISEQLPGIATIADHIIPLRSRWACLSLQDRAKVTAFLGMNAFLEKDPQQALLEYLWSEENGQGACTACHNWKTRSGK